MATELISPEEHIDDPEHYELLDGCMVRKPSVGRKRHSDLERIIREMLSPLAKQVGASVTQEWTMLNGPDKIIPDVTFSFPEATLSEGYLVAPAFLVVETSSKDQSLSSLLKKCRDRYHPFGTPYCWIIDSEDEVGYECHKSSNGLFRLTDVLTAGPDVTLPVAGLFEELKKQS